MLNNPSRPILDFLIILPDIVISIRKNYDFSTHNYEFSRFRKNKISLEIIVLNDKIGYYEFTNIRMII
jgi:hypothetical protein